MQVPEPRTPSAPAAASSECGERKCPLFPPLSPRPPLRPQPGPRSAPGHHRVTAPPRGPEGGRRRWVPGSLAASVEQRQVGSQLGAFRTPREGVVTISERRLCVSGISPYVP